MLNTSPQQASGVASSGFSPTIRFMCRKGVLDINTFSEYFAFSIFQ